MSLIWLIKRFSTFVPEISPYASVSINNWLRENPGKAIDLRDVLASRIDACQANEGFSVSTPYLSNKTSVSKFYGNLDNEGKPLAGSLAGIIELKHFYTNLDRRYQNVDFMGLPLGGEFRLLSSLNGFIDETRYNRLFRNGRMKRNSFGGVAENGKSLYDKLFRGYEHQGSQSVKPSHFMLTRRSLSFHDFGCLSKNKPTILFAPPRRNSLDR